MNKIVEALKKLLPADQVNEVASAINEMLEEGKKELEAEFNQKLEEAYGKMQEELQVAEATATEGYKQAYGYIHDLQHRLEVQKEEYESAMENEYEEAFKLLQAEKDKNKDLEVEIYKEFDDKLKSMKGLIVDKLSKYLEVNNSKIYEYAMRKVLNDPRQLEHKVVLDKIVDLTANYISDDDYKAAISDKIQEQQKIIESLKGQVTILETKNVRLSTKNDELNEAVRDAKMLFTEARATQKEEKKESKKVENVTGRGKRVLGEGTEIISEYQNPATDKKVNESTDRDLESLYMLAGIVK